jgi:hypothetical protein
VGLKMAVVLLGVAGCAHFNQVRTELISVSQIITMANEGIPADDIINMGSSLRMNMKYGVKSTFDLTCIRW